MLEDYNYIFGPVLTLSGLYFVIYGFKYLKVSFTLLGIIISFASSLSAAVIVWDFKTSPIEQIFLVLIFSFVISMITAKFMWSYHRFGVIFSCGTIGLFLGELVTVFYKGFIDQKSQSLLIFVVFNILIIF